MANSAEEAVALIGHDDASCADTALNLKWSGFGAITYHLENNCTMRVLGLIDCKFCSGGPRRRNFLALPLNPARPRLRPHHLRRLPKASPPPIFQHHPLHQSVSSPSVLKPWPYDFYYKWGRWILPKDCILNGGTPLDSYGGVLDGKVLRCFESDRMVGCVLRENDHVGLIKVGIFMGGEVDSGIIKPSYESRILTVLWGMGEDERDKLRVIFKACFRVSNVGKAFGFWCNEEDKSVYIVCQKLASSSLIDCVFNRRKDEEERLIADEISFWGVVGVETCEILMRLHLEGLTVGYLSLNCLGFDDFGRVCVDLSEVLKSGMGVSKNVEFGLKDLFLDQNSVFLSPEVLLQLFVNVGFELDSRNVSKVGPVSDVWSLASLLVWVLVGSSFEEEMKSFLHSVVNAVKDEKGFDYDGLYLAWMGKVSALLKRRLGSDFASLLDVLCRSLGLEPDHRPLATELWKCLRGLVVKPQCDIVFTLKNEHKNQESGGYIVLGDVCCMIEGHLGFITGLAIGGIACHSLKYGRTTHTHKHICTIKLMFKFTLQPARTYSGTCFKLFFYLRSIFCVGGFLFSSSYDKIVSVWCLEDFTHVHSFKGHEHKVMSVIFVDGEQQLCISGDNEGVICIWGATFPFSEVPMKKVHENKDWRYSGIHAMANSGTDYLYTGSGDRLVKAWSLQDHSFVCAMSGHKSVVSSLIVCNGILYSGSWDGTVRLWSLGDHSPLTILGEDKLGNVVPVSSLSADHNFLFVGHDNGNITIWHDDVLVKSTRSHEGSVFSVATNGGCLFSGGWDKKINVQQVSEAADGVDVVPLGAIACNSPITALLYRHGKLFVGQADRIIKVYYGV
ncbi:hypothetical protein SASPL_150077 [Salvia splendens]|uniref:Uncharacterized protein n=1 Tax=Salvia splendens TaxID=180675 RepID=A0A8X8W5X3_SALSN|nr:hypothetical protein SASPL_150077 [Salvia splendens]